MKDAQSDNLYEIVKKIIEDRETERIATESRPGILTDYQFRAQLRNRPGIERVLEKLAEHRELFAQTDMRWENGLAKDREETLTTIQEASHERIQGSCLCRATTYAFSKPPRDLPEDFNWEANYIVPGGKDGSNKWAGSHCYCDSCRVSAGALVATWFSIPRAQFELEKKGPRTVYK